MNRVCKSCEYFYPYGYDRGKCLKYQRIVTWSTICCEVSEEKMTTPRMIAVMTIIIASGISTIISLVFALIDKKRPPK